MAEDESKRESLIEVVEPWVEALENAPVVPLSSLPGMSGPPSETVEEAPVWGEKEITSFAQHFALIPFDERRTWCKELEETCSTLAPSDGKETLLARIRALPDYSEKETKGRTTAALMRIIMLYEELLRAQGEELTITISRSPGTLEDLLPSAPQSPGRTLDELLKGST